MDLSRTTIRDCFPIARLLAYGTSEGVSKAWDTRGRGRQEGESHTFGQGRHPEHGKFLHTSVDVNSNSRTVNRYTSPKGNLVEVSSPVSKWAGILPHIIRENGKQVFKDHDKEPPADFLKERYGITYGFK